MYTFWNKIKDLNDKNKFPPGLEPGTLSVLDSRDNHYTTETQMTWDAISETKFRDAKGN